MKNRQQGFLARIACLLRDRRGISAVEFAFVFPVMVTLYLGGTALTQGIVIQRKTALVTSTIGQIASQYTNITNANMTSILAAATSLIQPYPSGQLSVIVSSVVIDSSGNAKIAWSDSTANTTPHTVNSPVTLPSGVGGLAMANTSVIWAQGSYSYTLPVGSAVLGTTSMTLSDQFYLRPRRVNQVTRSAS
jgi:Flp pilus assembly protein TadG